MASKTTVCRRASASDSGDSGSSSPMRTRLRDHEYEGKPPLDFMPYRTKRQGVPSRRSLALDSRGRKKRSNRERENREWESSSVCENCRRAVGHIVFVHRVVSELDGVIRLE